MVLRRTSRAPNITIEQSDGPHLRRRFLASRKTTIDLITVHVRFFSHCVSAFDLSISDSVEVPVLILKLVITSTLGTNFAREYSLCIPCLSTTRAQDKTAKPGRCDQVFKMMSETTVLWNCNLCHSGPHWVIFECQKCKLRTCRPCTAKA